MKRGSRVLSCWWELIDCPRIVWCGRPIIPLPFLFVVVVDRSSALRDMTEGLGRVDYDNDNDNGRKR